MQGKRRKIGHLAVAFVTALALSGETGCPSSKKCEDYSPPPAGGGQSPHATLQADVMPLFAASCTLPTCHGSSSPVANNGIYLADTDPAKVRAALVDVASGELPSMPYVKAGDPRNSYLMRKLDGSQCILDAQCGGGSCGDAMPRGSDELSLDVRDAVRRWILQGAKSDE